MATALPRKMFVNLPVRSLERAIVFFEKLGFGFDPQFSDEHTTCMIIGDGACVMLLDEGRFREFARKPITDARRVTEGIFAISAASRGEVDELVDTALTLGGTLAAEKQEEAALYSRSFYDLDGHHWEAVYLEPQGVEARTPFELQADS